MLHVVNLLSIWLCVRLYVETRRSFFWWVAAIFLVSDALGNVRW